MAERYRISGGHLRVDGAASGVELGGGSAMAVSSANEGRLRYNETLQRVEVSENGGAFTDLGGNLTVPDLAGLAALDDTTLDGGGVVAVASLLDDFELSKTSTVAADGINVINTASGVGRWHRRITPSNYWAYRTTWYIDEAAGDDENPGTAVAPLASHDELVRRIGPRLGLAATVDVYIVGNYTGNWDWRQYPSPVLISIVYHGVRTVIYSGSVTAVVPYNAAGGVAGSITDAAIPVSWTASGLVDKLFVMTSGACNAYVGSIVKDLGAKRANYQQLIDIPTYTSGDPALGDTFDVYDLTVLTGALYSAPQVRIFVQDVQFSPVGPVYADCMFCNGPSYVEIRSCLITNGVCTTWANTYLGFIGCLILSAPSRVWARTGGTVLVDGTAFKCRLDAERDASIQVWTNSTVWSVGAAPLAVYACTGNVSIVTGAWLGIFDMPANSRALQARGGQGPQLMGLLWGVGNAGDYGLQAGSGGTIRYSVVPTFGPNAIADVLVGAVPAAYGALPVVDPMQLAGIVVYS